MGRAVSARVKANMSTRKMDKWQIGLLFCNILLSITGFSHCFLSGLLVVFYHMDKLFYLQNWYFIYPVLTGLIGLLVICAAFIGIVSTIFKNRGGLIAYSVIMGLTIIPQLLNIYVAGKVSSSIKTGMEIQHNLMVEHLTSSTKNRDQAALDNFYKIQESFGCCGVHTDHGYDFWNSPYMQNTDTNFPDRPAIKTSLPDSCCIKCNTVCRCETEDFFPVSADNLDKNTIFEIGCLPIIEMVYKRELEAVLDVGYMVFAVVCAILEFAGVLVSGFYVKVLAKRRKELNLT